MRSRTRHGRRGTGRPRRRCRTRGRTRTCSLACTMAVGKPLGLVGRRLDHPERQPLGRLRADARQPGQLVDQLLDGAFVHLRPLLGRLVDLELRAQLCLQPGDGVLGAWPGLLLLDRPPRRATAVRAPRTRTDAGRDPEHVGRTPPEAPRSCSCTFFTRELLARRERQLERRRRRTTPPSPTPGSPRRIIWRSFLQVLAAAAATTDECVSTSTRPPKAHAAAPRPAALRAPVCRSRSSSGSRIGGVRRGRRRSPSGVGEGRSAERGAVGRLPSGSLAAEPAAPPRPPSRSTPASRSSRSIRADEPRRGRDRSRGSSRAPAPAPARAAATSSTACRSAPPAAAR